MTRLRLTFLAIALFAALAGPSALADDEAVPPLPDGYLRVARGLCSFAVPEHNAAVTGELVPICDEELPRIFSQLGVEVPDPERSSIEVRVVAEPADMTRLAPKGQAPPSWSGAVAYPEHDMVLLALRHQSGAPVSDLALVFEHELSHLALRKAAGRDSRLPRWFSEGVAIQQSEASSIGRSGVLWWAAFGDELLPLAEIEHYPEDPGAVSLAYAEAADFVGFLLRRGGWVDLRVVLRRVATGEPFEEAFELAYRNDLAALEARWRESLVGSSNFAALITGSGALWGLITALFIYAYTAVKKRRRRRLAEMASEEEAVERLIGVMETLQRRAARKQPVKPAAALPAKNVKTKIRIDDEFHTLH